MNTINQLKKVNTSDVTTQLGIGAASGVGGSLSANLGAGAVAQMLSDAEIKKNPINVNSYSKLLSNHLGAMPEGLQVKDVHSIHNSSYDPFNKVVKSHKNRYFLAHELGHAAGPVGGNKKWMAAYMVGLKGSPAAGSLAGYLAARKRAMEKMKGTLTDEDAKKYDLIGYGAGPLASAPMLAEETMAHIRGLNALRKIEGWKSALKGGATSALPALAAYGFLAGMGPAAYHLAKKRSEKALERNAIKKK